MARKAQSRKSSPPDPNKMSFEQAVEELEAIIHRIEEGEVGLEESLEERKRGEALIKRCRDVLSKAEQELEHMSLREEGSEEKKHRRGSR